MAVYKLFPKQDATLYSLFPLMNTGLDEILDISNLNFAVNTNAQVARYLIQFDQSEINNVFNTYVSNSTWDADFKCFIATAQSINVDYDLKVHAVSGSWGMGTGKYLDQPISTDGTSWVWRTYAGGVAWASSGFGANVTASYSGSNVGGGNWYILPSASQTFTYHSDKDLNVEVTSFVDRWVSGTFDNNGFLVKWEDAIEFNQTKAVQPVLQYYSVDTNTIYPPVLEIKWNDFSYVTSSTIPVIETSQLYASIINNDGFFYSQSVQQFRVDCRPQFPPIIFQTSSIYTTNYYLPSGSSYWAIKDLDTNEYVIDFDSNYTQISADTTSSFFTVYMNGLQPERYYTILLKTTVGGTTLVFDSNYNFKVING
jgi:hypothetical protein